MTTKKKSKSLESLGDIGYWEDDTFMLPGDPCQLSFMTCYGCYSAAVILPWCCWGPLGLRRSCPVLLDEMLLGVEAGDLNKLWSVTSCCMFFFSKIVFLWWIGNDTGLHLIYSDISCFLDSFSCDTLAPSLSIWSTRELPPLLCL